MRIAIMQPYFFPYIGYFQLISAADLFVCLDDVAFIKRGWIHRNRLCFNNSINWFSIPLEKSSQFKMIDETLICSQEYLRWKAKLFGSLSAFYKKQAHFSEGMDLVERVFSTQFLTVADIAISSLRVCCEYLDIGTPMRHSSEQQGNKSKREARLVDICLQHNGDCYLNPVGGESLYTREMFMDYGINLEFLHSNVVPYTVKGRSFIPNLSILDAIMCCGRHFIQDNLLGSYHIVEAA